MRYNCPLLLRRRCAPRLCVPTRLHEVALRLGDLVGEGGPVAGDDEAGVEVDAREPLPRPPQRLELEQHHGVAEQISLGVVFLSDCVRKVDYALAVLIIFLVYFL